jgi:uncharacterized protein YlxP (DUF503 family)
MDDIENRTLLSMMAQISADLKRVESKMDTVLSLVDLIPNPLLRKVIRAKITREG